MGTWICDRINDFAKLIQMNFPRAEPYFSYPRKGQPKAISAGCPQWVIIGGLGGICISSFPGILFGSGFRLYAFGESDSGCNRSWWYITIASTERKIPITLFGRFPNFDFLSKMRNGIPNRIRTTWTNTGTRLTLRDFTTRALIS